MECGYISYRAINILLGINGRRNAQTCVVDRVRSGCAKCKDCSRCSSCGHKVTANKILPLVAHNRQNYVPHNKSFRDGGNTTDFLVYLILVMSNPTSDGVVFDVSTESLASVLGVSERSIIRSLLHLYHLKLITYGATSTYNTKGYNYTVVLNSYSDTFLPLREGGSGYLIVHLQFVMDLIAEMRRGRDINKLRLLFRLYQISSLPLPTSDGHVLSKSVLYDLLPQYMRKSQFDRLIEVATQYGLVSSRSSDYTVMPLERYDGMAVKSHIWSQCKDYLDKFLSCKDSFLSRLYRQDEGFQSDLVTVFARYGSLYIKNFGSIFYRIIGSCKPEDENRWVQNPSQLIHYISKIFYDAVRHRTYGYTPFGVLTSYLHNHLIQL